MKEIIAIKENATEEDKLKLKLVASAYLQEKKKESIQRPVVNETIEVEDADIPELARYNRTHK